jgi:hypothetical protein
MPLKAGSKIKGLGKASPRYLIDFISFKSVPFCLLPAVFQASAKIGAL